MKKILFLSPYPHNTAPSQRFRFEHYFNFLNQNKIQYSQESFIDQKTWEVLYENGNFFQKTSGILKGFGRRFLSLFTKIPKYDYIFIHREASPIGLPIFEWIISIVLRKKIIYDFDDAIWMPQEKQTSKIINLLKYHSKVKWICKWSYKVSCGNDFLADYARQFNSNTFCLPTVVDTENVHNKTKSHLITEKVVVGWTGTHSTLIFLKPLFPIIKKLQEEFDFTFLVISNKKPSVKLKNFQFIKWQEETEIEDLLKINIGLMPTQKSNWGKGKCGFKAIQYMSLGIPAIVSPISVNTKIVDNNINGFWCSKESDWIDSLKKLLVNNELRQNMGTLARLKVIKHYSVKSTQSDFLTLFS